MIFDYKLLFTYLLKYKDINYNISVMWFMRESERTDRRENVKQQQIRFILDVETRWISLHI